MYVERWDGVCVLCLNRGLLRRWVPHTHRHLPSINLWCWHFGWLASAEDLWTIATGRFLIELSHKSSCAILCVSTSGTAVTRSQFPADAMGIVAWEHRIHGGSDRDHALWPWFMPLALLAVHPDYFKAVFCSGTRKWKRMWLVAVACQSSSMMLCGKNSPPTSAFQSDYHKLVVKTVCGQKTPAVGLDREYDLCRAAVAAFCGTVHCGLAGGVNLAVGPLGRQAEVTMQVRSCHAYHNRRVGSLGQSGVAKYSASLCTSHAYHDGRTQQLPIAPTPSTLHAAFCGGHHADALQSQQAYSASPVNWSPVWTATFVQCTCPCSIRILSCLGWSCQLSSTTWSLYRRIMWVSEIRNTGAAIFCMFKVLRGPCAWDRWDWGVRQCATATPAAAAHLPASALTALCWPHALTSTWTSTVMPSPRLGITKFVYYLTTSAQGVGFRGLFRVRVWERGLCSNNYYWGVQWWV